MMNSHIIIGTAGHVDHGKTSLIKALTGIDCDTHPEEKIRGITIHLGFSHLDFENGISIGIVDVPGHKDFVNTMIAGASGIDMILLVIAADSGIMPQTVEHIQITQLLGIKSGVIVLTKIDLVDEELLLVIEEEVKEFIKDSFLKDAPIFKVSTKTGQGIPELKDFFSSLNVIDTNKKKDGLFRMFIDRIFSISGYGTVVTGSVLSGSLSINDKVFLLPGDKELKVRRLERHGKEVNYISAGNRAAINLVAIKKEEFSKGMVLCNKIIQPTKMVDANINLMNRNKKIEQWSHVIFLSGTYESRASIHLIDVDKLKCGENAIAQIHLEQPGIFQIGDKFIIRNTSSDLTLGGGYIFDPYPLHHKRRTEKVINELKNIYKGGLTELITAEVKKHHSPITLECILDKLNIGISELVNLNVNTLPKEILHFKTNDSTYLILAEQEEIIEKRIIKTIEHYHKINPLDEDGKSYEELISILGINRNAAAEGVMKCILDKLVEKSILRKSNNTWILFTHHVHLTSEDLKQINFVELFHKNSGMNTPLLSELIPKANSFGISENKLHQILTFLTRQKKIYCVEDHFIHTDIVRSSREVLINYLKEHPEGITVAQFRDLVNGNRKICLLLLAIYDRENIIYRDGDLRFITEKGRQLSYGFNNSPNIKSNNILV